MIPTKLLAELDGPLRRKAQGNFIQEVTQVTINIHEAWSKKLFDTEVAARPGGWFEDGRKFLRVDNRRGNKGMNYELERSQPFLHPLSLVEGVKVS